MFTSCKELVHSRGSAACYCTGGGGAEFVRVEPSKIALNTLIMPSSRFAPPATVADHVQYSAVVLVVLRLLFLFEFTLGFERYILMYKEIGNRPCANTIYFLLTR